MRWLVPLTISISLLLTIIPVSPEWREWRPEFMALIVIYWATYSPSAFGVLSAWICGLILDLVQMAPLGLSAFGLTVVVFLSHLAYQRIRSYELWQQAAWVFVLVGLYQIIGNWLGGFLGREIEPPQFLVAAVITALLWPVTVIMIRKVKIRFRIP